MHKKLLAGYTIITLDAARQQHHLTRMYKRTVRHSQELLSLQVTLYQILLRVNSRVARTTEMI